VRKTDSCNAYTISRTWSCIEDINRKWRKHRTQGRTLHFNTQNPDNSHFSTLISHKQSSQQHCCWGGSSNIVGICSCRPVYGDVLKQRVISTIPNTARGANKLSTVKSYSLNENWFYIQRFFFCHGATAPSGPRPPHYRGFIITLRHTTLGRTPLDEWLVRSRDCYLTTHNTHKRQTSMTPAGFELTFTTRERPQTHALDSAATGVGILSDMRT